MELYLTLSLALVVGFTLGLIAFVVFYLGLVFLMHWLEDKGWLVL